MSTASRKGWPWTEKTVAAPAARDVHDAHADESTSPGVLTSLQHINADLQRPFDVMTSKLMQAVHVGMITSAVKASQDWREGLNALENLQRRETRH